ncbi:MAG: hypothetical protein GY801_53690 [bacterium]|nr:hypothetical protein [bacterium]
MWWAYVNNIGAGGEVKHGELIPITILIYLGRRHPAGKMPAVQAGVNCRSTCYVHP